MQGDEKGAKKTMFSTGPQNSAVRAGGGAGGLYGFLYGVEGGRPSWVGPHRPQKADS